jgi:hypothetical protein
VGCKSELHDTRHSMHNVIPTQGPCCGCLPSRMPAADGRCSCTSTSRYIHLTRLHLKLLYRTESFIPLCRILSRAFYLCRIRPFNQPALDWPTAQRKRSCRGMEVWRHGYRYELIRCMPSAAGVNHFRNAHKQLGARTVYAASRQTLWPKPGAAVT